MYGDDDTHITGQITFSQIAEAIRHKKYGRDMREAIAQGFEYFQGLWKKLDILDSKYSEILQDYQNLDTRVGNCEKAISDLSDEVGAVKKQLSDHIDAQNKLNKNYDQRLQRLEAAIFGLNEAQVNYLKLPKQSNTIFEINTESNPSLKGDNN